MKKKLAKDIINAYYGLHSDKEITITVAKSELQEAFSTYENFKKFCFDKFGVDLDYLDYLERISEE